ncbi:hypothetical protein [Stenotrophomonas maltophilia]|uniref:hypothetical protein n=1 Tax=Stenotrophomonas maltophilia TaxID=40324 RepID=UPI001D116151|nr:hypothetical protein [Stenotrophomonas maltophilia]UXB37581.1 hypothetical protein K7563_07365 [Stenotrophomonas maltophilia]
MSKATDIFDKWFSGLSKSDQEEIVAHILAKEGIGPVMEGLFSGPIGKVEGGVYSGPAAAASTGRKCGRCGALI